jgi:tellurite methyltransferase
MPTPNARRRVVVYRSTVPHTQIHPQGDWDEYYRATAGRNPSKWFVQAVDFIDANHGNGRLVVDLGCGNGVETKAFLDRGWRVFATDREPAAIEFTAARVTPDELDRLTTHVARFADLEIPECDVVFAQLSLPFAPPDVFPGLWEKVTGAVKPGGFFVGQFLGPHDDWAGDDCLEHSLDDVRALLDGWDILDLSEEEADGVAGAHREPKYWHIVAVIAQRS